MDDNNRLASQILEKKTGGYGTDYKNFIAPQEITVTITLEEYRTLVANNATRQKDIDAATNDKFVREQQIKDVTAANDKLKGENYDLKTQIDELKAQIAKLTGKDCPKDA
ncbi:MAG: hypothetical protein IKS55_02445 [Oscillospiraceae bacterium]|nr:hypothetical protein [Oscillospiraceae bacterium]